MKKMLALFSALIFASLMPIIPAHAQRGPIACNQVGSVFPSSATTTKVVSTVGTGTGRILICGYMMQGTGGTVQLEYGTGGTCGSGTTALSPIFLAGTIGSDPSLEWRGLAAPNGNDVCVVTGTSTTAAQVFVFYTYGN